MSCWNKEQLENMLEDVMSALDLSDDIMAKHGPLGTPPAELVRLVLQQKDATIRNLRAGLVDLSSSSLDRASKNVESWPQWKQQVAGANLYAGF